MTTANYCARCLTSFQSDPSTCPNLACGANRPNKGWTPLLGAGDLLDRHYRIVKPLAVGGAGITYLAHEIDSSGQELPTDLAIKVLYSQRDSGTFLRRLSNEAQILQDLAHPHIVACRGFVQRAGHPPYLVTQFEHGGSLTDHLSRNGPLTPSIAASILRQILSALDIAHSRGIVHRDLKPDNVLLCASVPGDQVPVIRVADFGIAKVDGTFGDTLTRVGTFIGTPEYAAPEQFRGETPSAATDVFAAGALFYHLLVGQPWLNFENRQDPGECLQQLLRALPPQLPPDLQKHRDAARIKGILANLMAESPMERWTIPEAFAQLGNLSSTEITPIPLPPRPRPSTAPVPWIRLFLFAFFGLAANIILGALVAWQTGWFRDPGFSNGSITTSYQVIQRIPIITAAKIPPSVLDIWRRDIGPRIAKQCQVTSTVQLEVVILPDGSIAESHPKQGNNPCLSREPIGKRLVPLERPTRMIFEVLPAK